MSQRDYDFYNDQTLNRKMVCTHEEEPLTVKDKRYFTNRKGRLKTQFGM